MRRCSHLVLGIYRPDCVYASGVDSVIYDHNEIQVANGGLTNVGGKPNFVGPLFKLDPAYFCSVGYGRSCGR